MSLTFFESQLNPDTARETAKTFANVFYTQQNDEIFTLERHNLIRLLTAWGSSYDDNHIPIDKSICSSVFLKHLNVEANEIEAIFRDFEKDVNKTNMPTKKSISEEMNESHKRKEIRKKQKRFIKKFDDEKLGCFAVKTATIFDDLEKAPIVEDNDKVIVLENCPNAYLLDNHERKQQILLGYSILNLNQLDCDIPQKILQRCAKEDSLLPVEKDFIYYLWQNFEQFPTDLTSQLCKNFGFLYEKPILKACCIALKTGEVDNNSNELDRIAKLPYLRNRITAIFCDLYFLSGKSEKILDLYQKYF